MARQSWIGTYTSFKPFGESVNPIADATNTAALMRRSCHGRETGMAAGAWPALATSWHAKSPGYYWQMGPKLEKSGMPPTLTRAVKPPAE